MTTPAKPSPAKPAHWLGEGLRIALKDARQHWPLYAVLGAIWLVVVLRLLGVALG